MRHALVIFLVVLTTIFIAGCKKNTSELTPSIIGKWELRKKTGGIIGGSISFPPGNGNILNFTNASFERYLNGQINASGTYNLMKDTFRTGELMDKIILTSQNPTEHYFIKIESTQLTFLSDAMDGIDEFYEQVQ